MKPLFHDDEYLKLCLQQLASRQSPVASASTSASPYLLLERRSLSAVRAARASRHSPAKLRLVGAL